LWTFEALPLRLTPPRPPAAVDPPPPGEDEGALPLRLDFRAACTPFFFIALTGRLAASPYFFVPA
jgi:hypothetical protein